MNDLAALAALLVAGVAIFVGIGLAMKRREERWEGEDWRRDGPSAQVGNALLEIQSLVDPGARHAVEERQKLRKEEDGEGDPPSDEDVSR